MMQNSRAIQTVTAKTEDSSSLSKLSKNLAVLIIFFGATQFGLHFWPSSTLVYGIRIDYLSPTLYFLDVLIILYLCLQGLALMEVPNPAVSRAGKVRPYWNFSETRTDLIGMILPLLLANLLYSQNPLSTLSWSLHFLLYLSFALSFPLGSDPLRKSWPTAKMFSRTSKTSRETGSDPTVAIYLISLPLAFSLLFQTTLAVAQVYLGHYVGGIMYYLGERMVSVGSPGIALGSFMDHVILRAYGTFSHPNVLAGWLLVSLLIILKLTPTKKLIIGNWLLVISTITTIVGVVLTQSRSAAISLFGIIIPFCLIKKFKSRALYFIVVFSILASQFSPLHSSRADLSSLQRITLQNLSLSVIRSFPVFGTGAQSSISTYPRIDASVRLLQPDHNSFTLFLSWFGIFGLIVILYSLRPTTHNLQSLLPILPLLLFDHYLLTSPQGMFILLLYLSTSSPVLNYIHAQKNR